MKMALATLVCVLGTYVSADFIWDIPPEEFGKVTGETFVYDLGVGDRARIEQWRFCVTSDGVLAVDGLALVGHGDVTITVRPGMKLEVDVADGRSFLSELIKEDAYADCSWWTAHKGRYIRLVQSVNGKSRLSDLK